MLIDLGELSNGLGMFFIREFMETAEKMFCNEGQVLFRSGEATHNFYTLIQGELNLYVGSNAQHVYTIKHAGDVFGWSSLVGGISYSATAVCSKPSELFIFDSDLLKRLLKRHPESGLLFYKKLAETLGKRLLKAYQVIQSEEALVPRSAIEVV